MQHFASGMIAEVTRNSQWGLSLILIAMAKLASRKTNARTLSSRVVYRGPIFWVTTDKVVEPTGIRVRRDIVRHSGSVVILAVEESGREPRVLLERQYR